MDIGIVGLGRMGNGVATRLLEGGHRVVAYNRSQDKVAALSVHGAVGCSSIAELVAQLSAPRTVWLYLPAGEITDEHIAELAKFLSTGDTIIDGGNSRFTETKARHDALQAQGINFMDVGTSGGIRGQVDGYCLMIGGTQEKVDRLDPIWKSVAQAGGYRRVGNASAGHYVKMVHNAVEYGMMQAYAEGMELLNSRKEDLSVKIPEVADLWQHGSIVSSFLGGLLSEALSEDADLAQLDGPVSDSGEGRWSIEEALEKSLPIPVITAALYARYSSRLQGGMTAKTLNALRLKFGGHRISAS